MTDEAADTRFEFGENWWRFLSLLDEQRIRQAEDSLRQFLGVRRLDGRTFLDIGSGSGLFSLAARRLGGRVHSFDYDARSVACTGELRRRYFPDDAAWTVERGSVLDREYLRSLGQFDIVYSWGVLHHTGDLWRALENAAMAVAPNGALVVAIYNDQGMTSRYWTGVKRLYNSMPPLRPLLVAAHVPYPYAARLLARALSGRLRNERGMNYWRDLIDWIGGYPFEVARPEAIMEFYAARGFRLTCSRLVGRRQGCNEFAFVRRA